MTDREALIWAAVYAASWHATGYRLDPGPVVDDERARWCTLQAARALEALRSIGHEVLR